MIEIPVSVLILTFNEEINIEDCLDSVAWCDDVLVVDSGSSDQTVRLAKQKGARVLEREFDNFANQRNFGLEKGNLQYDWVLHLDADERVSDSLKDELKNEAIKGRKKAYRLASKFIFRGKWLKYSSLYPSYQIRFGKKNALKFEQQGHGQKGELDFEKIGTLKEPLDHYILSKGISDWIERHNRYSTDEAHYFVEKLGVNTPRIGEIFSGDQTKKRRAIKAISLKLPFRPLFRFTYMYVLRRGFLDGKAGFHYCLLVSIYQYFIDLKIQEIKFKNAES